jgi:MFS family permease
MSTYVFTAVGGGSSGLLLGGALTQSIDWHWIFFINVPVGVVTAQSDRTRTTPWPRCCSPIRPPYPCRSLALCTSIARSTTALPQLAEALS